MRYIEQIQQEDVRPPMWHYIGMTGTFAWFSDAHEAIIVDRIYRAMKANEIVGLAMRFCHYCEGPMGTMRLGTYVLRYISLNRKCSLCGNVAYNPTGVWERNELQ